MCFVMGVIDPFERAVRCCEALNMSGLLRVAVSPRSDTGLRFRDLSGSGQHCHLIAYWGIWRDGDFGGDERALLEGLSRVAQILADALAIDASVQLIVTDTHARLNGVPQELIDGCMVALKASHLPGVRPSWMSQIASSVPDGGVIDTLRAVPGGERLLDQACRQAAKLFPGEDAQARAFAYVAANLNEAPNIFGQWPSGIFFHIGPPELKLMLPSLPMLYGFAGPKSRTSKPWFS